MTFSRDLIESSIWLRKFSQCETETEVGKYKVTIISNKSIYSVSTNKRLNLIVNAVIYFKLVYAYVEL